MLLFLYSFFLLGDYSGFSFSKDRNSSPMMIFKLNTGLNLNNITGDVIKTALRVFASSWRRNPLHGGHHFQFRLCIGL
jgi:hypothetical protein